MDRHAIALPPGHFLASEQKHGAQIDYILSRSTGVVRRLVTKEYMKLKTTSGLLIKRITAAALVLAALPAMTATQIASQLAPSARISTVGGGCSYDPIVSSDGRYVLFASTSDNLAVGPGGLAMPEAVPAHMNVFLRDRRTGITLLVSVNAAGTAGGNGDSFPCAVSTNGQFAFFESTASDLITGDTNSASDVFVRDTVNNTTTLVSVGTNGTVGNGASREAAITPDGDRKSVV